MERYGNLVRKLNYTNLYQKTQPETHYRMNQRFCLSEVVWEEKQASESGEEVTDAKTNIEPDDDNDDGIEIN